MNCEQCDRRYILRSYCFMQKHPEYFRFVTGEKLTYNSFVEYAVDNELFLRTSLTCWRVQKSISTEWWKNILPLVTKALRNKKPQSLSEN